MPPDSHAVDEYYYILEGTATLVNPETGQTLVLPQGDGALIPARAFHLVYNFADKDVVIICATFGCGDESMLSLGKYTMKYQYYKGE